MRPGWDSGLTAGTGGGCAGSWEEGGLHRRNDEAGVEGEVHDANLIIATVDLA